MDYLRLVFALLLPWLGGYLWLATAENWLGSGRGNTLRQIGYGLFLGFAAVQGILLAGNSILGNVPFWPIMIVLTLLTLAGGTLFARSRNTTQGPRPTGTSVTSGNPLVGRVLFWLFASWAVLHLVFVAIEIVHRPVFPWDAWLNWIYRAKAWFYNSQVLVMDSPTQWLSGGGNATYNLAGNHYPSFVPALALWAAMAMGHWSETLVNLPVLCCGIALGLAMYGQCREYGLDKSSSALGAYLLLSIPLVGAHLALAGQADIWMAGFAGLGFVALLHGCIQNNVSQVLLGLGMTAIGIATKMEGSVWFLAALLTLALARYTRATLIALVILAGLATLGWFVGITSIDLPLLGKLGVDNGRVHIPLLGSYSLQTFELWDDYRDNFFNSGTWHLLWTMVLLSIFILWFTTRGALRRTIIAFYVVLLAAQLFIFEGTESGKWAEDWTAINRLPLHFAPALVFCLVILGQACLQRERTNSAAKLSLTLPVVSLIITLAATTAYLVLAYPGAGASNQRFTASQMSIVVGEGRLAGDAGIVERYQNNIALLSSGPVQLDATQLGLLLVDTAGPNRNRASFFWRNGSGPDDLHSIEISGRGRRWINLDQAPQWQGSATEIGLIFYADGDRPVEFHRLELLPHSLPSHLSKLAHDWRETATWSLKSMNWLPAGAANTTVPLPMLMGTWVVVATLLAALLARRKPGVFGSALLCAVAAWVILDLRWSANGLAQAGATIDAYPLASASILDFGDDSFTRQLVDIARPEIEQPGKRTIIMAEDETMRFQTLRAKYHALPAPAYVHGGQAATVPAAIADYIMVLKKRYTGPGHKPPRAANYANIIRRRNDLQATPVWDEEEGFLISIESRSTPDKPTR